LDDIPLKILKSTILSIATPLTAIVNSSLVHGIFPNALKIAKVCPVFKSGDKTSIQNYRPISILPSFSKVFEKAIFNRITDYFDKNKLMTSNQYGFRKNHSTSMALTDLYDRLSIAIDKNDYTAGVFIDLSKAFDTLDHSVLLKKLSHYGIRGLSNDWIANYLSNRQQCVLFNNQLSLYRSISCGIPQGSILSPLLFIIYINDIENASSLLSAIIFADDTNLFASNSNLKMLCLTLNLELAKMSEWFRANKLSLNVLKTNLIVFGNRTISASDLDIRIDGVRVERVDSTKFLGVHLDSKLTWKSHIEHVAKKLASGIGAMNCVKYIVPRSVMVMLYNTLILPYLAYCAVVWGCAYDTNLNKIFVLQNRAIRLVSGAKYMEHCAPLYLKLKLLRFKDIYRQQLINNVFKFKYAKFPASFMPKVNLEYRCNRRVHNTRLLDEFVIPHYCTTIRESSFKIHGTLAWNSLPLSIRSEMRDIPFKYQVKTYLLNQYVNQ
jgi:retron-type reverse transcriptase